VRRCGAVVGGAEAAAEGGVSGLGGMVRAGPDHPPADHGQRHHAVGAVDELMMVEIFALHRRSLNKEAILCLEQALEGRPADPSALLAGVRRARARTTGVFVTEADLQAARSGALLTRDNRSTAWVLRSRVCAASLRAAARTG